MAPAYGGGGGAAVSGEVTSIFGMLVEPPTNRQARRRF